MIEITEKKYCCGCSACVQKCPKQCILLKEDNEGFLYPKVDKNICINCGLCEKVCPTLHQREERKPIKIYAAQNKNEEIRKQSSSGGIFTLLAEKVIQEGGVVFGARFDEHWEVMHDYTETFEGLAAFRGSKYVQSRIKDNYLKAESFLKEGRKVLFSGTPCQIAGLKRFLRKEFENLLTIDFVCHGVPSPGIWRKYLNEKVTHIMKSINSKNINQKRNTQIEYLTFRNKETGWKKYSFTLDINIDNSIKVSHNELHTKNTFMKGFLADLYLRPSCYNCMAKCGKSGSDITIGDLWGAHFIIGNDDDNKGTSLVLINNKDRLKLDQSLWTKEIDYLTALTYNPAIEQSVKIPSKRNFFYADLENAESLTHLIEKSTKIRIKEKILRKIKNLVNRHT